MGKKTQAQEMVDSQTKEIEHLIHQGGAASVADNAKIGSIYEGGKPEIVHQVNPTAVLDGKASAVKFMQVDETKKVILLHACQQYGANESDVQDWLKGFGDGFGNKDTAKVRKSEASSVFDAYNTKAVQLPVGFGATDGKAIYATKSGAEWLVNHKGGFNDFIDLSRKIRGGGTSAKSRGRKSMSDKGMEKVEEMVAVMTPAQASEVIARGVDQVIRQTPKGWEHLMVLEMQYTAERLKTSPELHYQKFADDLLEYLNAEVAERERLALPKVEVPAEIPPKQDDFVSIPGEATAREVPQAAAA